jgi:cation transport ATPase
LELKGDITTYKNVLISLNKYGSHPLNKGMQQYLGFQGGLLKVRKLRAIAGKGIQGNIDGETYYLGFTKMVPRNHWKIHTIGQDHIRSL